MSRMLYKKQKKRTETIQNSKYLQYLQDLHRLGKVLIDNRYQQSPKHSYFIK